MSNKHMQELTALSLTGTVVDRGHGSRPHFASASPEDPILSPAPPAGNFDSPQPTWSTSSVDPRIVPPTIPPTHTNRTLVLCFDGTGDQFSTYNSNIVHFVSLLRKDDKSKQMVYYQVRLFRPTTQSSLVLTSLPRCLVGRHRNIHVTPGGNSLDGESLTCASYIGSKNLDVI